jgi:hypothetical protein
LNEIFQSNGVALKCEIRLRRVKYWASPNVKYSAAAECDSKWWLWNKEWWRKARGNALSLNVLKVPNG